MNCEERPEWGTRIERGVVTAVNGDTYTVESYDRPGIIAEEIGSVDEDATYSEEDKVCFFFFPDGTGKIICGFEQ